MLPHGFYHPSASKKLKPHQTFPLTVETPKEPLTPKEIEVENDGEPAESPGSENFTSSGSTKYNESWNAVSDEVESVKRLENTFGRENSTADVDKDYLQDYTIDEFLLDFNSATEEKDNVGTIAKFVQRFREEPAKSRQERQSKEVRQNDDNPFWWCHSPVTEIIHKQTIKDFKLSADTTSEVTFPQKNIEPTTKHNSEKHTEVKEMDKETGKLQDRAKQLLELSENTINSSYFPNSSTTVSGTFVQNQMQNPCNGIKILPHKSIKPRVLNKTVQPEGDVLYQWRLKRKMEMAKSNMKENAFLSRNPLNQTNELRPCQCELIHGPIPRKEMINGSETHQNDVSCNTKGSRFAIGKGDDILCPKCCREENLNRPSRGKDHCCCHSNNDLELKLKTNERLYTGQQDMVHDTTPLDNRSTCDIRLPKCDKDKRQDITSINPVPMVEKLVASHKPIIYANKFFPSNESDLGLQADAEFITDLKGKNYTRQSENDNNKKITPAIEKVIYTHLFDNVDDSLRSDTCIDTEEQEEEDQEVEELKEEKLRGSHPEYSSLITDQQCSDVTKDDSSSDEEFFNDEILIGLRAKRKAKQEQLRNIIDALELLGS